MTITSKPFAILIASAALAGCSRPGTVQKTRARPPIKFGEEFGPLPRAIPVMDAK